MRKIFTIGLFTLTTSFIFSQGDVRNFRFGLKVTPTVNWFKPDGNIISNNGVGLKYGGGLILEYLMGKIISIQSGVQIDVNGGKVKYNNGATLSTPNSNSVSYFYNNLNSAIVNYDPTLSSASNTHYQLNDRSYNISYITIPLTLKMKTKEIGNLTYYGQFGINNSFRWKATATDDVQQITPAGLGTSQRISKIDVTKDVSLYTAALNMGLGAEMNLSGSTSLTFGLNYLLGFTNIVQSNSSYLERQSIDGNGNVINSKMPQQLKSSVVALLVGVLF
jgi:hypothetical protein